MKNSCHLSKSGAVFKYHPSQDFPYFLSDPCDSTRYYKTEADMLKDGEYLISTYLDDDWNEEVEDIEAGLVMYNVVQCDKEDRPSSDKIDEDGCDEDGVYWGDYSYICNYKLNKI